MDIEISIVIPTQRRLEPLQRAVRSAFAQKGVETRLIELGIVDNEAVPSAKDTVAALAA